MITHSFRECPRCHQALRPTLSHAGTPSEFFLECVNCNTFVWTFLPLPHQASVLQDATRFTGNFGGFGTGKTYTTRAEILKHAFLTPNGLIVIGANVTSQYEQTIKKELEADLPHKFVKAYSLQKSSIDLINGCRIIFRPFDDPDKLRSYNASMFVILEGSEVKYNAFAQLKTRCRNMAAAVPELDPQGNPVFFLDSQNRLRPKYKADWRKGIVESNPDAGWVRTDFVLQAASLQFYGDVMDQNLTQQEEHLDPAMSAHIAATDVNTYLPEDYYENNSKNKPAWWIKKFLHGSFAYSEGLVYPGAQKIFVPKFEIPRNWKRLVAFDYGLQDPSVFLFAAIDQANSMVYIYKEARRTETNIELLAKLYQEEASDIPDGGFYCAPIIDPKSGPRRDYNKKSLIDHFIDFGIFFEPGDVNLEARIYRLNTYIECNHLRIFDCCTDLRQELENYKFKDQTLDKVVRSADVPEDKNNHSINAAEWICMRLPADPAKIMYGGYGPNGLLIEDEPEQRKQISYAMHVLSDDLEETGDGAYNMLDYRRYM